MKKQIFVAAACFALALSLCGCSGEQKLAGIWQGDGTLDMYGMSAPFEFADELALGEDGSAIITVDGVQKDFTWTATSDTITLSDGTFSYGVLFQVKGNTLYIGTSGESQAVFSKIK